MLAQWGCQPVFTPANVFHNGEQGFHFEAYDPTALVQRRNLLTYSEQFGNAAWNKTASGTGVVPAVTDNYTVNDRGNPASRVVFDHGAGNTSSDYSFLYQGITAPAAADANTFTVRMKSNDGNTYSIGFGGSTSSMTVNVTPVWQTFTIPAVTSDIQLRLMLRGAQVPANTGTADLLVSEAQYGHAGDAYQKITDWITEYLAAALESIGMWQDSAGTTPVTGIEQPVGLWLDGKYGKRWPRGPQLWNDANVTFGTNSSRVSPGVYRVYSPTGAETADVNGNSNGTTTIGQWYEVTFNIDSVTAAGGGLRVGASGGSSGVVVAATVGPKRVIAQTDYAQPIIKRVSGTTDIQISNVSYRQISAGTLYHATQSTTTKRPILKALYNLLVGTDTLATQSVTTAATNYKLTFTGSGSVTLSGTATGAYNAGTYTITATAGTLTVTVTGTVTKADLRTADDAAKNMPAYQAVRTSTDYDYAGFPVYLKPDGVDDFMQTASMDLTAYNRRTTWVNGTKLSDAALGMVLEHGVGGTDPRAYSVDVPRVAGANDYGADLRDGVAATVTTRLLPYAAPDSCVLTILADYTAATGAAQLVCRRNGTAASPGGGNSGGPVSGAFGNYPIYLFARAGTSLFFGGRVYSLTDRASTTPSSQRFIAQMEQYGARLQGLSFAST